MSLVSWTLVPLGLLVITLGLAAGVKTLGGVRFPAGANVPFGLCLAFVLCLLGFWAGLEGPGVAAVVGVLAVVGALLGRAELRETLRHRAEWFALGLGYLGYMLPVIASGEWTWTGYNFVNDTAVQFLLADGLRAGTLSEAVAGPDAISTTTEVVRTYDATNYPLGTHALLAVIDQLTPGELASKYQPVLGFLGGSAAAAFTTMLRSAGARGVMLLLGGALVVGGNLTYQYALQGNLKELGLIASLAAGAALADALYRRPTLRLVVALSICGASILAVYSAAGAPYLLGLALATVLAVLITRQHWSWWAAAIGLATLTIVLAAAPALSGIRTFNTVATGTFATAAARETDFGHLLRPLLDSQMAGVWLAGDYRLPIDDGTRGAWTDALITVVVIAAIVGLVETFKRRAVGVLIFAGAVLGTLLTVSGRVSPYANGKLLAIGGCGVVLLAVLGVAANSGRQRGLALMAGLVLVGGIGLSDVLAYRTTKLAPVDRFRALEDVDDHLANEGLVLHNEPEEFAKYFYKRARVNLGVEAITPAQVRLRTPVSFQNRHFDLDAQSLKYVEQFPYIVKRRSPDASRPPANFRQTFANSFYEVWKRDAATVVRRHLPLGGRFGPAARASCEQQRSVLRSARPGTRIVAAVSPRPLVLDPPRGAHTAGWVPDPYDPDMLIPTTPGRASKLLTAGSGGRYRGWVEGTFGRAVTLSVDGRRVGEANGVDNLGQWADVGTIDLEAGRRSVEIFRGGAGWAPGDGYEGRIGRVMLVPPGRSEIVDVSRSELERCTRRYFDWIEVLDGP